MAPTLEERVTVLEHEVSGLKARSDKIEPRVESLENDINSIPELIRLESRLNDSRFARIHSTMESFRKEMNDRFNEMDGRFNAVIRAISEIVAEKPRRS